MKGKWYMTVEVDGQVRKELFGRRRNPISTAKWIHVQCKFCDSFNVFRFGFDKKGKQRFICNKCGRTFIDNKAPEKMQFSVDVIASAINQFYEAASLHKISRQLKLDFGVSVSHMTIYRWVMRYSQKAAKTLANVPTKVGNNWVAEETVLKLKSGGGENIWLFDSIDDTTKFLLSSHLSKSRTTKVAQVLMEKAEQRANLIPESVTTDKLKGYLDAVEKTWGADTKHIQSSPFVRGRNEDSTRAIERFHGTLKDRTKVMRALADKNTAKTIMDGWLVHYNFFRPHEGLKDVAPKGLDKTPAEAAQAQSPFKSWKDVVQDRST